MTPEILKDYIIYKIYCKNKEINDEYYGHTSAFRARKSSHKTKCNTEHSNEYNTEKYKIIRLNGGWDNWDMVPIEEIKNCSLINAKIREQFYIDMNKTDMNQLKAYITEEQTKEYQKQYYVNNKENINIKSNEYYVNNKEKINEKKKQYRENNKEKQKQYYENNKEKMKEKMTCICGSTFRMYSQSRHEKSKKHCDFIK